jgi:hypothetical protein
MMLLLDFFRGPSIITIQGNFKGSQAKDVPPKSNGNPGFSNGDSTVYSGPP